MDLVSLPLAVLRGLHLAALLSAFGTLVFTGLVAPPAMSFRLVRQARTGAMVALVSGAAWFAVQARVFADSGDLLSAVWTTALYTRFGHMLALRLLLILFALLLTGMPRAGMWLALLALGSGLAMQGLVGHAGAAEGNAAIGLVTSEALHLLAAGAWIGALPPLLLCLSTLPPHEARLAAERFSPLGLAAVLVIAATAVVQAIALVGGFPNLAGTAYGRVALVKLALFGAMLAFAVWNRLSLTDRLDAPDPGPARKKLFFSVAMETICGLAVVFAASLLASLVPGAHDTVVWPFASRPSLEAMGDPDLRQEVALALLTIGAGVGVVAVSLFARRFRVLALLFAVALTTWQAPSFGLLLVEAYPTSYLTSPTGFSATSIRRGQMVFAANCAACHGVGGHGDGPAATGLRIKPADLTAGHLLDHRDGELFWWIGHGIENPEGGLAMPGFAESLGEDDRWAAIDFVRALNAGASFARSGLWTNPVAAPDLPIACDSVTADRLSELHGGFVRIVTTPVAGPAPSGATILRLDAAAGGAAPTGGCASATTDAWSAYAIVTGAAEANLTGWEFLVDPNGWLRSAHGPHEGPDWNDPLVLRAALRDLRNQPITGALGGIHVHGH